MVRTEGKLSKDQALDLAEDLSIDFHTKQHTASEGFCTALGRELSEISKATEDEISEQCSAIAAIK